MPLKGHINTDFEVGKDRRMTTEDYRMDVARNDSSPGFRLGSNDNC